LLQDSAAQQQASASERADQDEPQPHQPAAYDEDGASRRPTPDGYPADGQKPASDADHGERHGLGPEAIHALARQRAMDADDDLRMVRAPARRALAPLPLSARAPERRSFSTGELRLEHRAPFTPSTPQLSPRPAIATAASAPIATHHAPTPTLAASLVARSVAVTASTAASGASAGVARAPIQRTPPDTTATPTTSPESASASAATPPGAAGSKLNLDQLADDVYARLRWRLNIERERHMGRP